MQELAPEEVPPWPTTTNGTTDGLIDTSLIQPQPNGAEGLFDSSWTQSDPYLFDTGSIQPQANDPNSLFEDSFFQPQANRTSPSFPPSSEQPHPQPLPLPLSIQSTVFQQQLVARFQQIYIPSRRHCPLWSDLNSNIHELPSWVWISHTVQKSGSDNLLNDIVLALVLGNLGLWENNTANLRLSSMLHARAVRRLRARIKNKAESQLDSTLAAVMVFGVYELQIGSTNRGEGYWAHLRGVNALLALRGASIFETPYGRKLFWGSQFNQFVIAVRKRGDSSVMRPNYPDGYPGVGTGVSEAMAATIPKDMRLYPIIQQVPPLMARVDQFQRIAGMLVNSYGSVQASRVADCLYGDLVTLEVDLEAWEKGLFCKSELFWDEPSTLYALNSERLDVSPVFETRICFPSIRVAHALILSWTASLIISSSKRPLLAHVDAKDKTDDYATALRIIRSMEYFLHPDMGLQGTNLIGMSLEIARQYFQLSGTPEENSWFDVVDARMAEMRTGLGDFLKEVRSVETRTL